MLKTACGHGRAVIEGIDGAIIKVGKIRGWRRWAFGLDGIKDQASTFVGRNFGKGTPSIDRSGALV